MMLQTEAIPRPEIDIEALWEKAKELIPEKVVLVLHPIVARQLREYINNESRINNNLFLIPTPTRLGFQFGGVYVVENKYINQKYYYQITNKEMVEQLMKE